MHKKIMRRVIFLLTAVLLFSCGSLVYAGTVESSGTCGENATWTLDSEGVLTISGTGEMEEFNWKVSPPWSSYKNEIKSIIIEKGVTSIEYSAFSGCENLTNIIIPNSVTFIGKSAFHGCSSLPAITIPEGVTFIEEATFYGCESMKNVTLPNSLTSIGPSAFSWCESFTDIIIPDNVTLIDRNAFYNCKSLTSVTLPDSLTSIGGFAFYYCRDLTSINLPYGLKSIGKNAFDGCESLTRITIPNSVTSIGEGTFSSCISLTSVIIPDGITSIKDTTFNYCRSLTSITIPDSVTSMGDNVFSGSALKYIFYEGSVDAWSRIKIESDLDDVIIHYNATGHTKITDKKVEPTCISTGLTEGSHCSVCNVVLVQQEVIPAKGHKYGSWKTVTSAACTTTGKQQRACSSCKKVDSKTIAKLGHNYSTAWTIDKKASVSTSGSKSHHCKRCDKKKDVTKIAKIKSIKLSKTSYVYNGNAKSPTVVIKNANDKTISSKNYTVTKAKGRTKVGKYSYKIVFKNEYKGTKTLYFKINPKAATIKSPVAEKKAFTVKWSKVSKQATGYEIMYATNSKFTKGKKTVKVTSYNTTSKKISKLSSKKTYYVKVRTYKTVDGVKYYSTWSDVKKIKTK